MLLDIKKKDVVIYFSVFFSVLLGECQVRDFTVAVVMLPGPSLYLQLFIINLLNKELMFLCRLLPYDFENSPGKNWGGLVKRNMYWLRKPWGGDEEFRVILIYTCREKTFADAVWVQDPEENRERMRKG
jgi:hypothetical protein